MIDVTLVRSSSDRREFIDLPFRLYRGDPYWVPPLKRDVAELLDPRRHPFHQHAEVALFLARAEHGRVVGRIAAIKNDLHIEHHHEPLGFFGFFECERDPLAADALFDAAGRWLAARGLSIMRGPASPSLNEECGLLVHGFDSSPAVMMPYNPPWYADLIEGHGFRKAKDLLAYIGRGTPPERLIRMSEALARRRKLSLRSLDKRHFWDEVERVRTIYNAAWEKNWGFVPMTEAEFTHLAKQMRQVVEPALVAFAEVDGQLAGFVLGLPDVNRALKHMGGRLLPFGWLKGLWYGRRIDFCRVFTLGVLEPYRRTGAAEMLILHIMRAGARRGIHRGEFSWILEDNTLMRAALEKIGATVQKIYRMYDRPLDT